MQWLNWNMNNWTLELVCIDCFNTFVISIDMEKNINEIHTQCTKYAVTKSENNDKAKCLIFPAKFVTYTSQSRANSAFCVEDLWDRVESMFVPELKYHLKIWAKMAKRTFSLSFVRKCYVERFCRFHSIPTTVVCSNNICFQFGYD